MASGCRATVAPFLRTAHRRRHSARQRTLGFATLVISYYLTDLSTHENLPACFGVFGGWPLRKARRPPCALAGVR
eukprot:9586865-Heterocapsa_arctica.AAC.1